MALQASGEISLSDIQTEYGGSNPIAISEYYGSPGIPSSGPLELGGSFHGQSNITYIAATGGTVTTSGDYKIHTFTGSGSFVISDAGNQGGVDYLVVAGGGGGQSGSGAGAGGYLTGAGLGVSATSYAITVGGGGAVGTINWPSYSYPGTPGGNSVFSTSTSIGGGAAGAAAYGNYRPGQPGGNGGSGGGGGRYVYASSGGAGGAGTAGQGNNGGAGTTTSGGGGGAGGAGATGAAGTGLANSISGSSITYSTGGYSNGAGGVNKGDGGGSGNAGGSGVVIIRYQYQ